MTDPEPCPPELEGPLGAAIALLRAAVREDHEAMALVILNADSPAVVAVVLSQWLALLMADFGLDEAAVTRLATAGGLPQA